MDFIADYASDSSEGKEPAASSKQPASILPLPAGFSSAPAVPSSVPSTKRPLPKGSSEKPSPSKKPANQPRDKQLPGAVSELPEVRLLPPQLRGRSNIVTEDLGKIFANKRKQEPSKAKAT